MLALAVRASLVRSALPSVAARLSGARAMSAQAGDVSAGDAPAEAAGDAPFPTATTPSGIAVNHPTSAKFNVMGYLTRVPTIRENKTNGARYARVNVGTRTRLPDGKWGTNSYQVFIYDQDVIKRLENANESTSIVCEGHIRSQFDEKTKGFTYSFIADGRVSLWTGRPHKKPASAESPAPVA